MPPLYTMAEVLEATGGHAVGVGAGHIAALSIDSREMPPGALFVAIRGERFDGHDFVGAALANGAVAALVSADRVQDAGGRLIVVPDALEGLVALARHARARSHARIVAVTGSAGKTTTREAIRTVLAAAGPTHASIRSFNNHWGVPLTLARLPADAQFGVFEIGMNHAGEITPLTRLVRPHIAVITTVAAAHLEFFESVAAIAAAKAEIFRGLEPGGTAVVNIDHDHADVLLAAAREAGAAIVTYGAATAADWCIEAVEPQGEGSRVTVRHDARSLTFGIGAAGRHMAANAVAALAVGTLCGLAPESAAAALAGFVPPEGRGAALALGPAERPLMLVDESYNANAASMQAALQAFAARRPAPGGRKVLVLGDMLELGPQGPALHRALAGAVRAAGADRIYLVGPAMAALAGALGGGVAAHAREVEAMIGPVVNGLAYGDAIMVKGSNGVRLGALVKAIRDQFL